MLIGSHESVAGGLDRVFGGAERHHGQAIQLFTKNSSQWKEPDLAPSQVEAFRRAHAAWGGGPLIAHESYLVNLCAEREDVALKSRDAIVHEMNRCESLGVSFIALHPGAAVGAPVDVALERVAEGLSSVLDRTRGYRTRLCLENTAGQGSTLGWSLDELATMLDRTDGGRERLGICVDTQHLFAAGYDLRSAAGYDAFWDEFDRKVGIARVCCFHLNDSKKALGQRVDRHEQIGKGEIGLYPFWRLLNDPRFSTTPAVVELPIEAADASLVDLSLLRGAPEPPKTKNVQPLALTPSSAKPKARRSAKPNARRPR